MTELRAEAVSVDLGGLRVLKGVDFSVRDGEVVGLIGPNGSGKTTLIRALLGLQPRTEGRLTLDGRELARLDRRELGRRLAYLPQGGVCHWPLTVEGLVTLGRLPHQTPWRGLGREDAAAISKAMVDGGVQHLAGRAVTTLSGGERTRALLARAIAGEPEVLLADEPVASLDPYHQLHVMALLNTLAGRGGAVVIVLHDLTLAARFCDRLVLLDGGRVRADGPPAAVLGAEHVVRAYRVEVHAGVRDGELYVLPWRTLSDSGRARPGEP